MSKYEVVLFFCFVVSILILFFIPHFDNDFGWHHRCGSDLVNLGKTCSQNSYSYFLPNYIWAYPSFIYDILIFTTFNQFGFLGISAIGSLVFTSAILLLYFSSKAPALIKVLLLYVGIYLSWSIFSLGFRSQIVTLLFYSLFIFVLTKHSKKALYILPFLSLLWANTHAGFFLGIILVAIKLITSQKSYWRYWFLVSLFCFIATLVNPFTYKIYIEVLNHFRVNLAGLIAEWVPPQNYQKVIIIISWFILVLLNLFSKRNIFDVILVSFLAIFAIIARRNIPLYFLTIPILLPAINYGKWTSHPFPILGLVFYIVLFVLVFAPKAIIKNTNFSKNYCNIGYVHYPCQGVEYLKNATGNIFNTYEWGGFLIWKLPNAKIFVDGRMPAWIGENGESPYTSWLNILQANIGWDTKLKELNTKYIFISEGTFLDLELKDNPGKFGYQEKFRGDGSVIYETI